MIYVFKVTFAYQLTFQGVIEWLHVSVVRTMPRPVHAVLDTGFRQRILERWGRELDATIGMQDYAFGMSAFAQGICQGS